MRVNATPRSEITAPDREEFYLRNDLTTPDGCYEECRVMVSRIVMMLQGEMRTKDAVLHWLSRKYRLGSMPRKVCYGEPARIYAHQMTLLRKAFQTTVHENRLKAEHFEYIAKRMCNR